jgi:hypothetical protein
VIDPTIVSRLKGICDQLYLRETVEAHVSHVLRKL